MPPLLAPTRHPHLNCGRSRCSTKSNIGSPSLHSSPVHHLLQRSPASTTQNLQNEIIYARICGLHVPVHFCTNSDAGDVPLRMQVTSGRWSGHAGVPFEKIVWTATVKIKNKGPSLCLSLHPPLLSSVTVGSCFCHLVHCFKHFFHV